MKIVISGYYGFNNSGDDALLQAIIDDIRFAYDKAEIIVLSNDPDATRKSYGVHAVYRYNAAMALMKISACDLLISGGGTLIQDATSTKSLIYYLTVIRAAKFFKKKIMLYANGIGPLTSFKNIEKTKKVLNEVDLITLRDENSVKELEQIGITKPHIKLTADPAFLLEPDISGSKILDSYSVPRDMPILCVSVRRWKNNPENFEQIMADFCDYAHDRYGFFTIFLPMQHKVDYALSAAIKNKMKNRSIVIGGNYSVQSMLSIINEAHICVGMRLHTLIYSAGCNVPSVGIVYDPKINGFLEYMGESRFIKVEEISAEALRNMFEEICGDYDTIKSHLKFNMRIMREKASENRDLMKKLLDGGGF